MNKDNRIHNDLNLIRTESYNVNVSRIIYTVSEEVAVEAPIDFFGLKVEQRGAYGDIPVYVNPVMGASKKLVLSDGEDATADMVGEGVHICCYDSRTDKLFLVGQYAKSVKGTLAFSGVSPVAIYTSFEIVSGLALETNKAGYYKLDANIQVNRGNNDAKGYFDIVIAIYTDDHGKVTIDKVLASSECTTNEGYAHVALSAITPLELGDTVGVFACASITNAFYICPATPSKNSVKATKLDYFILH